MKRYVVCLLFGLLCRNSLAWWSDWTAPTLEPPVGLPNGTFDLLPLHGSALRLNCDVFLPVGTDPAKFDRKKIEKLARPDCLKGLRIHGPAGAINAEVAALALLEDPHSGCADGEGKVRYRVMARLKHRPKGTWFVSQEKSAGVAAKGFALASLKEDSAPSGVDGALLRRLVQGPYSSAKFYKFPASSWYVAEVAAVRTVSGDGYAPDQPNKPGTFLVLFDPAAKRYAHLVDSLGVNKCGRDRRTGLIGFFDVDEDGELDIVAGDQPYLVFFRRGELFELKRLMDEPCMC